MRRCLFFPFAFFFLRHGPGGDFLDSPGGPMGAGGGGLGGGMPGQGGPGGAGGGPCTVHMQARQPFFAAEQHFFYTF